MKRIPGYPKCFGCGSENPFGLRLELAREGGRVVTRCRLDERFGGFEGVAHGGILASVLDEVMTWAAVEAAGRRCLTGEMTIRYLRPVPLGAPLRAWGEPAGTTGRYLLCRGVIEDGEGEAFVRAEGKFFPVSQEASPPA